MFSACGVVFKENEEKKGGQYSGLPKANVEKGVSDGRTPKSREQWNI